MTDLNKYANNSKPQNFGLLKNNQPSTKPKKKKEQVYTEPVTISLSKAEVEALDEIQEETGAGRSAIIRRLMKKGGLEIKEAK